MEETVTVPKTEYERLQKSEDLLDCLRACGVDNWEGYATSIQMHSESYPDFISSPVLSLSDSIVK